MLVTHDRQPFCRCCGKKLKRLTETHVFGIAEGEPPSSWGHFGTPHPEEPATRAEAQRFLNQRIVSSKKDYRGRLMVATWDGESYFGAQEHFCTLRCAADYGRFAVTYAPDLMTQAYAVALASRPA